MVPVAMGFDIMCKTNDCAEGKFFMSETNLAVNSYAASKITFNFENEG